MPSFLIKKDDSNDDNILLNTIIKSKIKHNKGKSILIDISRNNTFVINIIKQLEEASKTDNNINDSIYNSLGIDKKTISSVFNKNEFQNFISQQSNSSWKSDDINCKKAVLSIDIKNNPAIGYIISKPIYTIKRENAIVFIGSKTSSYLTIYKRVKKKWKEQISFAFMLH